MIYSKDFGDPEGLSRSLVTVVAMVRDFLTEIVVRHSDLALTPTLEAVAKLDLQIESQPATAPETPDLFYSAQTPDFQTFEAALEDDHTVAEWQCITEFDDQRIYRIRLSREVKILTPTLTDLGIRVLNVTNTEGGWHLRLHTPKKELLTQFQTYCDQEKVHFQIEKLYRTDAGSRFSSQDGANIELTDRQREVAQVATEMGYFDQDGATAEEVAAHLDITRSTLSTHLRQITSKLFHHYFQVE